MGENARAGEDDSAGPSQRATRWTGLAWSLWATSFAFALGAAFYAPRAVATQHVDVTGPNQRLGFVLTQIVIFVAFSTVGAVVASRRPRHPVGWILLSAGWLFVVSELAHGYAHHTIIGGAGNEALGTAAALISILPFVPAWALVTMFLPLLFPDGKLLSPRWRFVVWVGAIGVSGVVLKELLGAGPLSSFPEVVNPLGLAAISGLVDVVGAVGDLMWAVATLLAGVSVVVRFVRSRGVTRQQFKWVAFPAGLLVIFIPLNEMLLRDAEGLLGVLGNVMFVVALGGLPVGVGVAVLRYRLYQIDRIVSRTVSYIVLTLVLVGVYAGAVLGLGSVLRAVTVTASSDVIVAASTLLVAAIFQPARRRIQAVVDRRFNRGRYDAQRTLYAFAERLRDEVDLSNVVAELEQIAETTMQPTHVSLWVRSGMPEEPRQSNEPELGAAPDPSTLPRGG